MALFGDGPTITIDDPVALGTLGMPDSGCIAEARTAVYGSVKNALLYSTVGPNFMYRVATEIEDDAEYVRLNAAWASRIAEAGWVGLDTPAAGISKARHLAGGRLPELAAGEPLRIAIADATCQAQTDYAPKRRGLEDRYVTALLTNLADPVDQVTQIEMKAMAGANALLEIKAAKSARGVGNNAAG